MAVTEQATLQGLLRRVCSLGLPLTSVALWSVAQSIADELRIFRRIHPVAASGLRGEALG
jgi:hypothetical protein